jgi:hypothetical protein
MIATSNLNYRIASMSIFRTLILSIALLLTSNLQAKTPNTKPNWQIITAGWNNGTVAPPYRQSGSLRIQRDGSITLINEKGYDGTQRSETKLRVTEADILALHQQLLALNAYKTRWKASENPPIGGSQQYVDIQFAKRSIQIPSYAHSEQERERARKIWAAIMELQNKAKPEPAPAGDKG